MGVMGKVLGLSRAISERTLYQGRLLFLPGMGFNGHIWSFKNDGRILQL